ncbi:hypothetical protein V5799_004347 [Amblyomma americanum]|uniref:Cytosolic endo-beta-N-acetylglucosaminidase TIM barrel domain-containing protein n=1 Tax=Amblyomma americanum TaxID=6943 RepID=A0AAQ4D6C9_AMBAM
MGVFLSRKASRRPPPTRVVKYVPERAAAPLTTLEQLLNYKDPLLCAVEPLNVTIRRGRPEDPKNLFCHDMMGGYHEDRFVHGSEDNDQYRFHHWHAINTFVYYTHNLVTIPPPGWISAAHRHGVKVLGTFMLGSDEGLAVIKAIKDAGLGPQVAEKLAFVATLGRFDGWLVSIGCRVDSSCVTFLKDFLEAITEKTHSAVPGSMVIWYDAVDTLGNATPHNELNNSNSSFFELCDGIFLNFHWTEDTLQKSAQLAGDRKADVYVGVDVFGRDTHYSGGFNTSEAVKTVRTHGLSAAIFAAGWVYETRLKNSFIKNQYRLWDFPDDICPEWRFTALPISTSFCQGLGHSRFSAGARVSSRPWFNLAKQQLQPRDQGNTLHRQCGSATVYLKDAYNGGSCLRVLFNANKQRPDEVPYFRSYYLQDKRGAEGATLDEIGVRLFYAGPDAEWCLLGQLDVKRPEESSATADPGGVAGPSKVVQDYEPVEKRPRMAEPKISVAGPEIDN